MLFFVVKTIHNARNSYYEKSVVLFFRDSKVTGMFLLHCYFKFIG